MDGNKDYTTRGNRTLNGQIATFIENLHLSYSEVMSIPYRTLTLMSIDKLSFDTSVDKKEEQKEEILSGKELMKRKMMRA